MTMMVVFFFFKQMTAYEMRISDWSSDVCSSDLHEQGRRLCRAQAFAPAVRTWRGPNAVRRGLAAVWRHGDHRLRDGRRAGRAGNRADRRLHPSGLFRHAAGRRWDRWWNGALAGFALLVQVALGYGSPLGNGAGEDRKRVV